MILRIRPQALVMHEVRHLTFDSKHSNLEKKCIIIRIVK